MNGRKRVLAAGVLIGLVAGASGMAVAAVDTVPIKACVNSTGGVRILTDTGTPTPGAAKPGECKSDETFLWWNQTGPAGATGPAGPQGPQGPQGVRGPKGDPGPASGQVYYDTGEGVLAGVEEIARLDPLPAGDYLVQGDLRYNGGDEKYGVRCDLQVTNGTVYLRDGGAGQHGQVHTPGEFYGAMAFQDAVTLTQPGSIVMECYQYWSGGPDDVHVLFASLSATATPKLTTYS
ncbi:hypothetical protein Aph01nite_22690 [Acrocarpospora phusangensis]|uniref:Uncharacterized protein n=1 Tax=Acrocarpospora phusangensis TaxID=1070424 RepID=A0A919UJD4_9ACTN|nr:hypothetical protein [Acrocarpospora phusangensis]GIH23959.1 hypothetical protein Aph01nite_22690 [Acrocarpospora phusangensis]